MTDDKRLAEIRKLADANTGPKFGYTHDLCEAVRYLLSLLAAPPPQEALALLRDIRAWLIMPSSDGLERTAWPERVAAIDAVLAAAPLQDKGEQTRSCSFCGKLEGELIPAVKGYICKECVKVCADMIKEDRK